MTEGHYRRYLKEFSINKELKDFLFNVFVVFTEIVKRGIFLRDWIVIIILGNRWTIITVLWWTLRTRKRTWQLFEVLGLWKGSLSTRIFEVRGRQPEEKISHARTVLSPRFLYYSFVKKKRYLAMWIWFCENSSLPVTVRVSKARVLKFPNILWTNF